MKHLTKRKLIYILVGITVLLLLMCVVSANEQEKKKTKPVPRDEERAGWELGKIAPVVTKMAKIQDMIDVIVYFKGKTQPQVKQMIEKRHLPKIEALKSEIEKILQKVKKKKPHEEKPDIEQHESELKYLSQMEKKLSKVDREQLNVLRKMLDAEMNKMRKSLLVEVSKANEVHLSRFENSIKELEGKIKVKIFSLNAFGISIPSKNLIKLAKNPDVIEITLDVKAELEKGKTENAENGTGNRQKMNSKRKSRQMNFLFRSSDSLLVLLMR